MDKPVSTLHMLSTVVLWTVVVLTAAPAFYLMGRWMRLQSSPLRSFVSMPLTPCTTGRALI